MWGGYGGMDTVRHKPVEMKKHHYAWRKIKGGGWLSGGGGGENLREKQNQSSIYEL